MTTARQRLSDIFQGPPAADNAVCLHSWGYYPFQAIGKGELYGQCSGEELAGIYEAFWLEFQVDWLHVLGMPLKSKTAAAEAAGQASAEDASESDGFAGSTIPMPTTKEDIDRIVERHFSFTRDGILENGDFEHIRILSDRIGAETMILPNQGSPGGNIPGLGFEDHMILIHERPDLVEHFARGACRGFLERVRCAKECGADGFILSEGYGASCDMISPALYERVFLEAKREFYSEIKKMGLLAVGYFLGDIRPYLPTIEAIGPDGLMIEESKKGFRLSPAAIREKLSDEIALFGNIDSSLLLRGSIKEIQEAVADQAKALRQGRFVFINGSPICPDTPPDNLRAFIEFARGAK